MTLNSVLRYALVAALGLFATERPESAFASEPDQPDAAEGRPRIGLVLSGGGARGLAHIGILKVLEELRIPVDCIAGTSMGALVAGAYAAGVSPSQMEEKVGQIDWSDIFEDDPARTEIPYKQKGDDFRPYFGMELGWRSGALLAPSGTTSGYKFEFFIRELIGPALGSHNLDFDELPIPFRAVATDLEHGTPMTFAQGDLARVMRASMSVPGVIAPVAIDGSLYVDGGLVNNLPIDIARATCADVVIAVNLGTPLMTADQLQSVFAISAQSVNLLTELNVKSSLDALSENDILISPELNDIGSGDFERGLEAVPRGEQAARAVVDRLRALGVSANEYGAWQQRRSDRIPAARPVTAYRFTEGKNVAPEVLLPELQLDTGEAFSQRALHSNLIRLYGRGDFERVAYHFEDSANDRAVVLEPSEKPWGPDYVRFGFGLGTDLQSTTRVVFAANHRKTWLNSRGAEWRNEIELGFRDRISTEIYQPYSARRGSTFFAARAEYRSEPEIFYLQDSRIGEYDVTTARAHFEVGAQDHLGEVRIGIFTGTLEAKEDFGLVSIIAGGSIVPDYDLNQTGATALFLFDQLDNPDFPRHGALLSARAQSTHENWGSDDDYDKVEMWLLGAYTRGRHTVVPGFFAGDNLGSELPPYDLFQLGGYLRLSGYEIDELTGSDYTLARLVYYYRYTALPTQLGGGVYIGGSLEAGRIRDGLDASLSGKPQAAASLFIGADTVLGPLRFAIGQAERGNTSFYFILGRVLPL